MLTRTASEVVSETTSRLGGGFLLAVCYSWEGRRGRWGTRWVEVFVTMVARVQKSTDGDAAAELTEQHLGSFSCDSSRVPVVRCDRKEEEFELHRQEGRCPLVLQKQRAKAFWACMS